MACYYRQHEDTAVTVPKFTNENSSGTTYYDIKVRVGKLEWVVERRYRDFASLHEKLVGEISISKKLLPPKKVRPQRYDGPTYSHMYFLYLEVKVQISQNFCDDHPILGRHVHAHQQHRGAEVHAHYLAQNQDDYVARLAR